MRTHHRPRAARDIGSWGQRPTAAASPYGRYHHLAQYGRSWVGKRPHSEEEKGHGAWAPLECAAEALDSDVLRRHGQPLLALVRSDGAKALARACSVIGRAQRRRAGLLRARSSNVDNPCSLACTSRGGEVRSCAAALSHAREHTTRRNRSCATCLSSYPPRCIVVEEFGVADDRRTTVAERRPFCFMIACSASLGGGCGEPGAETVPAQRGGA